MAIDKTTIPAVTADVIEAAHLAILETFQRVRQDTLDLTAHLEIEDYGLQAMPEVSPPKWHLAHTCWFFETFILKPFQRHYASFDPRYEYLFNSYYNSIGKPFPRPERGLLSRPRLEEVLTYRAHVDQAMTILLADETHPAQQEIRIRTELGLHHEQQHQELLCTDIKYNFSRNPLYPRMSPDELATENTPADFHMIQVKPQRISLGYSGPSFHYDNESPIHEVDLPAFQLANRLVNNAEYLDFIQDGGYQQPALWLSDGWAWNEEHATHHPLYWVEQDNGWKEYTLHGLLDLHPHHPVIHVNFYEADAYARWRRKRLPTEFEWEAACRLDKASARTSSISWHPAADAASMNSDVESPFSQWFGSAWQWTQSSYAPYPRYRPAEGAIGEYNGKFMCNQQVLRGSSCVTPAGHARVSYRNFFYPKDQWQFSGIRLADDLI